MFGYSARNAFATASATFTSTAVYHTTLPSFAAAATNAGVVSWPIAFVVATDAANARNSAAMRNNLMASPLFVFRKFGLC